MSVWWEGKGETERKREKGGERERERRGREGGRGESKRRRERGRYILPRKTDTVVREIFVVKNFSYAQLCTKIKCTKFFIAVYKVCMLLR